jgi:pimeloyl-ACP methyl ester carboxylesterase
VPFATNNGVRIHYEVEGQGEPLVLQHGFSSDLSDWRTVGYVDALRDTYQCILIDARGHGQSDKPHDPEAYELINKVKDVFAVLDDIGIEKAHYWGYSMGGVIGLSVATNGGERFRSVVMGGAAPGPRDEVAGARLENYLAGLDAGLESMAASMPPERRERFLKNDPLALRATVIATQSDPVMNMDDPIAPILFYNGGADPSIPRARAMASKTPPSVRYEEIGDLDHGQGFQRSDLVLPVVRPFLEEVSRVAAVR